MGPRCACAWVFAPSPHNVTCPVVFCKGFGRSMGFGSGCRLLLGSTMGWLCGTTTSTSAADEDLDEEEMDLVRTERPDLPPPGVL